MHAFMVVVGYLLCSADHDVGDVCYHNHHHDRKLGVVCYILLYTVYGGHLPAHHRVETIRQASFGALGNLKNILGLQLKK